MGPSDISAACRPPKSHHRETLWLRCAAGIVGVLVSIEWDWEKAEIARSPFIPTPTLSFSAEAVCLFFFISAVFKF